MKITKMILKEPTFKGWRAVISPEGEIQSIGPDNYTAQEEFIYSPKIEKKIFSGPIDLETGVVDLWDIAYEKGYRMVGVNVYVEKETP